MLIEAMEATEDPDEREAIQTRIDRIDEAIALLTSKMNQFKS